MDDMQDHWIQAGQLAPMDLFISKNQSLSLGLIMNMMGNDTKLINKIREGYQKGLFELALHGWDHIDHTELSENEQKDSLHKTNEKMKHIFGNTSKIFIPPLDKFNNSTLKSMSVLGIQILSSTGYAEARFNNNRSILVADGKTYSDNISNTTMYHIPGTILFKQYANNSWNKTPLDKILNAVSENIEKYGYAVVVIHPQDFVKVDENGEYGNIVDESEIKDLSRLIDSILSKNIHITSFSKLSNW
jgi:peptidoglycan/xylan/chitin deacetylase (PgdA/CDA1 family)